MYVCLYKYIYIYIYIYIYVCVCVCVCLQNVFHTLAMFYLFYCFIQLWADRKTAIVAMPVPHFLLLLLIFYYVMYYM